MIIMLYLVYGKWKMSKVVCNQMHYLFLFVLTFKKVRQINFF
jgi:hypothetical protein